MSVKVKYNKGTLGLINQLMGVTRQLTIEKTEDEKQIKIITKNASDSVAYNLFAPADDFNFEGKDISFYDYSEFHNLFSVYEEPELFQNEDKFLIQKGKSKTKYNFADKEALDNEYDYIAFNEVHAEFKLSADDFKTLQKMSKLIQSEYVKFVVEGNQVTIQLFGDPKQPTHEETFEIDNKIGEDFNFTISKDILNVAPENDYTLQLRNEGLIKFVYNTEKELSLDLYVSEVEDI